MTAAAVLFLLFCHPLKGEGADLLPKEGFELIRKEGKIGEYRMPSNGLRVLLLEDHSAPVAAVMVSYQVGTRDEIPGKTEAAHFLEHLMFKGTARYNRRAGTAVPFVLEEAGAILNATTEPDATHYYEVLPSDRLDLALDIEADRMRGSLLREKDIFHERQVILNEFERNTSMPVFALMRAVWKTAFRGHPYGHAMMGERKDIENIPGEYLKGFYDTYYWPDHAVLTVVGDFKISEALDLIREKFGNIPHSPGAVSRAEIRDPGQEELRRVTVERPDPFEALAVACRIPPARDRDTAALEVLGAVLAGGKNSLLYRRLVDRKLAANVGVSLEKMDGPGLFLIQVSLADQVTHDRVEKEIFSVLSEIRKKGITKEALRRAKKQLHAQEAFSRDGAFAVAGKIAGAISMGDWTLFETYPGRIDAVTSGDVLRAARLYLVPERMTIGALVSKSVRNPQAVPVASETAEITDEGEELLSETLPPEAQAPAEIGEKEGGMDLGKRVSVKETDGIKIFCLKTEIKDAVTLMGSFEGGGSAYSRNPLLAPLVVGMLDKGTEKRDQFEIARVLEDCGAQVSFSLDYRRAGFSARCLKEDVPLVLKLVAEQLRRPRFDAEEFEKLKQRSRVGIQEKMTDPDPLAFSEISRLIYPPEHPNYQISCEKELEWLETTTPEEARDFYKAHYGKQGFILVAAGDIEPEAVQAAAKKEFKNWKSQNPPKPYRGETVLGEASRKDIFVKGRKNLTMYFGHAMPFNRLSGEYLPVFFANYVLGGSFSARLSGKIRDELGLTYSVSSRVGGMSDELDGDFLIRMISVSSAAEKGISEVEKQLAGFVSGGIREDELARNQNAICGRFKVDLASTQGLAGQILKYEELGLGIGYLDGYPSEVKHLSLVTVNDAIKRFYHPSRLCLVVAGDFGKKDQN